MLKTPSLMALMAMALSAGLIAFTACAPVHEDNDSPTETASSEQKEEHSSSEDKPAAKETEMEAPSDLVPDNTSTNVKFSPISSRSEHPEEAAGDTSTGIAVVPGYWEDESASAPKLPVKSDSTAYVVDPDSSYSDNGTPSYKRSIRLDALPYSYVFAASVLENRYLEEPDKYENVSSERTYVYSHSAIEVRAYVPENGTYIKHIVVNPDEDSNKKCSMATVTSTVENDGMMEEYLDDWML